MALQLRREGAIISMRLVVLHFNAIDYNALLVGARVGMAARIPLEGLPLLRYQGTDKERR